MKRIRSVKLWFTLISSCCIGTGITLACSDGWGEEFGISNFSPEVFVDSVYTPFFYSQQYYYQIGHDEQQDTRFNNSNSNEWYEYLQRQVNRKDLEYLLQQAGSGAIDSAARFVNGKLAASPSAMLWLGTVKQKNNKDIAGFLEYLQLAKKSEAFALNHFTSYWNEEQQAQSKKAFDAVSLNQQLKTRYSAVTDKFLKERYWFQLLRSYFFNNPPQQVIDLFSATEKDMPHNVCYYRAMAYTAGAYYKLKQYSRANYLYSLVYENSNALKTVAHYSFHPQEEKDWTATLALCKNNEEKITLWQMLGVFYADEQRAIKQIYLLNPASDKLDLLLARAINKYEQKFNAGNGSMIDMPVDTMAMQTLPALVIKIAGSANTGKPWVWQIAAGYLKTLDAQYAEADAWFAKAGKTTPANQPAQAQLRLLKMINSIARAKKIDSKLESLLVSDINWLNDFDPKEIPQLRYRDAFDWLKQQMAATYRKQHDFVKAECFTSTAAFYTNNQRVEALKAFLTKTAKSPFEVLCTKLSAKQTGDLFEFQAIQLTYADSIEAAIEKMAKAGTSADIILLGNPFNGSIHDCHDCDHEAAQKIKYTTLSFLKKIQELKKNIAAGTDLYNNALLLANAHYNITHFGNARLFYECKVLGEGHSNPFLIDSSFRKMLTRTAVATHYYTLALQNTVTDEQRAKCQYMLAKCQRNQWYNDHIYNKAETYNENNMVNLNALDGFKALKQLANTQYYKEVLAECGYFKTYMSTRK